MNYESKCPLPFWCTTIHSPHLSKKECLKRGEGPREGWGERERIPSRLRPVSTEPNAEFEFTSHEIMTWAEIKSWTLNQLSHPGAPRMNFYNVIIFCASRHTRVPYGIFIHTLQYLPPSSPPSGSSLGDRVPERLWTLGLLYAHFPLPVMSFTEPVPSHPSRSA